MKMIHFVFRLMPRIRIGSRDSACQTSRPLSSCYFLSCLQYIKQNYICNNVMTLVHIKVNADITISELSKMFCLKAMERIRRCNSRVLVGSLLHNPR
jgi:hypothetical protein